MKKILIFIFVSLISSSCLLDGMLVKKRTGLNEDKRLILTTDAAFHSYINSFKDDYSRIVGPLINLSHIPINFGARVFFEGNESGVCLSYGREAHKEIRIKKSYWDSADTDERELLIYHELGHCFLNKEHNRGIMRSPLMTGSDFSSDRMNLVADLMTY